MTNLSILDGLIDQWIYFSDRLINIFPKNQNQFFNFLFFFSIFFYFFYFFLLFLIILIYNKIVQNEKYGKGGHNAPAPPRPG